MSKATTKPSSDKKLVRCAIYTRKSTEEGLQQEFNSLDAQREAGQNYIAAQKHEGWVCLPDFYDDGGFTMRSETMRSLTLLVTAKHSLRMQILGNLRIGPLRPPMDCLVFRRAKFPDHQIFPTPGRHAPERRV